MDTLVFDIETKNFFTDPDVGWNNFAALEVSAVGVYSYLRDKYFCFDEFELEQAASLFATASTLIGFSSNRYDVPVLHIKFGKLSETLRVNLWDKARIDLLEEIEVLLGQRVSLDKLARANLGVGKDRKGYEAITMYKNGEIEELKEYCLQDVKLTKELYDLFRKEKKLLVPNPKTKETVSLDFSRAKNAVLV